MQDCNLNYFFKVFTRLLNLKDKNEKSIWREMEYEVEMVPVTSNEKFDLKTFSNVEYSLSDLSKEVLSKLANELIERQRPYALVFASCYSYRSSINDVFAANGLLSSLYISVDKGAISSGTVFALDNQQKQIIMKFRDPKV